MRRPPEPGGAGAARSRIEEWLGPDGRLARSLPHFEHRPGQCEMAVAVLEALKESHHLVVEAGTGTGKTLAYLLPAILSGERVIISTATKTLQDQLFTRDIPLIRDRLDLEVTACTLKGRDNYLCKLRSREFAAQRHLSRDVAATLRLILDWEQRTSTGDRGEIAELPEELGFWPQISAKADTCLGQKCPDFQPCFLTEARTRALASQIVIVNHHLYFADLTLREHAFGQILPDHRLVIFDEAHQLEEIAQQYFTRAVSSFRLRELCGDVDRFCEMRPGLRDRLVLLSQDLSASSREFFERFRLQANRFRLAPPRHTTTHPDETRGPADQSELQARVTCDPEWADQFLSDIEHLRTRLGVLAPGDETAEGLANRAGVIASDLEFVIRGEDAAFVYWGEKRTGGTFLRATRADVSEPLRELLFERRDSVILTSATLSIGGSFRFVRERLGIEKAEEQAIASPFDYPSQAILYAPRDMPEPRRPGHMDRLESEIRRLLEISRGRAFLLFTSYAALDEMRSRLSGNVNFPLLCQGDEPKNLLLERFRLTPSAVLLGTTSFWQGVDVPGEALSLVVIDKLPFEVPTDPLV
ncbi:MAG: ATP-dependent DNA helicase, partial [Acidobacteriota bacterium]